MKWFQEKAMAKTKKNKKNLIIVVVSVVILCLVAGLIWFWASILPGYLSTEKAVSNYFTAISNEDSNLYKKTCYTGKWRNNYKGDVSLTDRISEALSMQSGATYGNVQIISVEKLDKEYAEKMTDSLKTRFGINQKISQIARVNFTVDTVFEGQSQSSGTITRYCYKCGGKWFFLAEPEVIVDLGVEG